MHVNNTRKQGMHATKREDVRPTYKLSAVKQINLPARNACMMCSHARRACAATYRTAIAHDARNGMYLRTYAKADRRLLLCLGWCQQQDSYDNNYDQNASYY